MNWLKKMKSFVALMFVCSMLVSVSVISCDSKATGSDTEEAAEDAEHPAGDSSEHPAEKAEHPAGEHPKSDSTKVEESAQ